MISSTETSSILRCFGPVRALNSETRRLLFDRTTSSDPTVRDVTSQILADIRCGGDRALHDVVRRFDGVVLEDLEVPRARWRAALDRVDPGLRRAMERAIQNISAVHRAFLPRMTEVSPEPGIVVGRRPDPLDCIGIYAPGGRAAYPSSVLMGAVPAHVAGVREIILTSPPGPDGQPAPVVLAAAELAGVGRMFALGGAAAIGGMAFGTETVPRVDRIVGPGNAFVAEAKLQVSGYVGIDTPAGPSELLILADSAATADVVAREMMAQAEHDERACVVALAQGRQLADEVYASLMRMLPDAPRREIIESALAARGAVLWVDGIGEAVQWANEYAPEHLLVCAVDPEPVVRAVRNVGTIFVGETASVSFGDYMTGANHVLPTGGLARSYSGLSTADFFRWTTYQRVDRNAAASLSGDVDAFATAEGLRAHADAARAWSGEVRP